MHPPSLRNGRQGFTRTDALAVLTTLVLLAGLLLSVAAGTRATSESILCRANLKHLGQAWQAFALDHSDRIIGSPEAQASTDNSRVFDQDYWAAGLLSWDGSPWNTNREYLQIPAFVPYVGRDTRVFHCPSDRSISTLQRQRGWSARVRSYSMNFFFGPSTLDLAPLRRFLRLADVPDPAAFFVLAEEHPDSINDPVFITTLDGNTGWVDLPASFHDRAANFVFADAHVETRRWADERTVLPVRYNSIEPPRVAPTNPDFRWLLERTSVKGK